MSMYAVVKTMVTLGPGIENVVDVTGPFKTAEAAKTYADRANAGDTKAKHGYWYEYLPVNLNLTEED
jgi:hypothetical protein